jgi:hypothetical protein
MSFWHRSPRTVTPSEAAKILSDYSRVSEARRAVTLGALRECVATGRIAKLGWK